MDFIEQVTRYIRGPSKYSPIPEKLARWSSISLLAGILGKRVFLTKPVEYPHKVYPSLFTFLVAPTTNYKSHCKSRVIDLLDRTPHLDRKVNLYPGKVTGFALFDQMRKMTHKPAADQLYLIQDELSADLGIKDFARYFLKVMNEAFLGDPIKDHTRTGGEFHLEKGYSINWLACSTPKWLCETVDQDTLEGGLGSRLLVIYEPNRVPRRWELVKPTNEDAAIITRIREYLVADFEVTFEPEVLILLSRFYEGQQAPASDFMRTRSFDMLLKLMLLSCMSQRRDRIIAQDFGRASAWLEEAHAGLHVFKTDPEVRKVMHIQEARTHSFNALREATVLEYNDWMRPATKAWAVKPDEFKSWVVEWMENGAIRGSTDDTGTKKFYTYVRDP